MTRRERAIAYAEEHRAIHVEWRDFWRAYPPKTREDRIKRASAGGVRHHEWAIRRYDVILRELRSA